MANRENPSAFKHAFDPAAARRIGDAVTAPGFDRAAYLAAALPGLTDLEMKDRVRQLAAALRAGLPGPFPADAAALVAALGPPGAPAGGDFWGPDDEGAPGLVSFPVWPLTRFVALNGLGHPDAAIDALGEMTRRFTAEFALRPYLLQHRDLTLARLAAWARSPDQHLRRAASEATRPRLPWGVRLAPFVADPEPVIRLITPLRADPEPYVRRSVANNLNDIAKDHPDRVLEVAEAWWAEGGPPTRALVRHALRTLIKAGHPRALRLLGFTVPARVAVEGLRLSRARLTLGETQALSFTLRSTSDAPQRLLVDYVLGMARARGKRGEKVFKGRQLTLSPRGSEDLTFRLPLRAVTTRRYYAGAHSLQLLVCGERLQAASFELIIP